MNSRYKPDADELAEQNWPDEYDFEVWLATQNRANSKPTLDLPGQLMLPWCKDEEDVIAHDAASAPNATASAAMTSD
jgi:hypothetical protein